MSSIANHERLIRARKKPNPQSSNFEEDGTRQGDKKTVRITFECGSRLIEDASSESPNARAQQLGVVHWRTQARLFPW